MTVEKIADLRRLLSGASRRRSGHAIVEILAGTTATELTSILTEVGIDDLVAYVDDHLRGPKNRSALLRLLGKDRLPDLHVALRVAVIRTLQLGRTGRLAEETIRDVFLGTTGDALTVTRRP